jgi:hypothetical protein
VFVHLFCLQRRLAAMTPQERAAHDAERVGAQRREERKSRLLQSHLAGYAGFRPPVAAASGTKRSARATLQPSHTKSLLKG